MSLKDATVAQLNALIGNGSHTTLPANNTVMQAAATAAAERRKLLEAHIAKLDELAITNTYRGPPNSGALYGGWPIDELIKLAPSVLRNELRHELHARGGRYFSSAPPTAVPMSNHHTLEEMLAMRMRWGKVQSHVWAPGLKHLALKEVGDQVHIWIINTDGQDVVLQDELGLFPSDTLVTKIRMMSQET